MAFILADDEKVSASATFVDAAGNVAPVQGAPVWASSDESIVTVTDNGDGTVTITSVGPLGTAQVSVTADADLGDGVTNIVGTADIEVVASQAVAASIGLGTPEKK